MSAVYTEIDKGHFDQAISVLDAPKDNPVRHEADQ